MTEHYEVEGIPAFVVRAPDDGSFGNFAGIMAGTMQGPCGCGKPHCKGVGVSFVLSLRTDDGLLVSAMMTGQQVGHLMALVKRVSEATAAAARSLPERPERVN